MTDQIRGQRNDRTGSCNLVRHFRGLYFLSPRGEHEGGMNCTSIWTKEKFAVWVPGPLYQGRCRNDDDDVGWSGTPLWGGRSASSDVRRSTITNVERTQRLNGVPLVCSSMYFSRLLRQTSIWCGRSRTARNGRKVTTAWTSRDTSNLTWSYTGHCAAFLYKKLFVREGVSWFRNAEIWACGHELDDDDRLTTGIKASAMTSAWRVRHAPVSYHVVTERAGRSYNREEWVRSVRLVDKLLGQMKAGHAECNIKRTGQLLPWCIYTINVSYRLNLIADGPWILV